MPDGATDNAQPQSFARSSLAFALLTTRLPTSTLRERRSPPTLTNGTPAPKLAASGDLRADPPTLSTPRPGLFASLCTRQPAPIVGRRRTGSSTPVRSLRLGAAPPSCPVGQLSAASTLLRNLDVVCASGPSTYHQSAQIWRRRFTGLLSTLNHNYSPAPYFGPQASDDAPPARTPRARNRPHPRTAETHPRRAHVGQQRLLRASGEEAVRRAAGEQR